MQFDKNPQTSCSTLPKTEQQKSRKDGWYLGEAENRRGRNETHGLGNTYQTQSHFGDIKGKYFLFPPHNDQ